MTISTMDYLKSVPHFFENNACEVRPLDLRRASLWQCDQFDIVLSSCRSDGMMLEFASWTLKDHPKIACAALENNARSVAFISHRLKSDLEFVKSVLHLKDLSFICGMDERFTSDDKVALELLRINPNLFNFLNPALKANRSFLLQAVQQQYTLYNQLGDEVASDLSFLNELCFVHGEINPSAFDVVEHQLKRLGQLGKFSAHDICLYDPRLWDNPVFILEVIAKEPRFFKLVSSELRFNDSFIKFLLHSGFSKLYPYLDDHFKNDPHIALICVTFDGELFKFMPHHLQTNKQVALRAISHSPHLYPFFPAEMKKDPEIAATTLVSHPHLFQEIPHEVTRLPQFWAILLHISHDALCALDHDLLLSKSFWKSLLLIDEDLICLIPKILLEDKEFKKTLVKMSS